MELLLRAPRWFALIIRNIVWEMFVNNVLVILTVEINLENSVFKEVARNASMMATAKIKVTIVIRFRSNVFVEL